MADIFTIDNPANPIRLVQKKNYNPSVYWNRHFDDDLSENTIPDWQTKVCYCQKYNKSDKPRLQTLSNNDTFTVQLFDRNGSIVKNYAKVLIDTEIIGFDFECYEIEISFDGLSDGYYQVVSVYQGENGIQTYYSEPISIKDVHKDTMVIEYTNSENNFGLIFDSDWKGFFRVEATIYNYRPASDDVMYIDQKYNNTRLYGQPYRIFTLTIGKNRGVPDWVVDKVNRALCFDQVMFDGEYYNKLDGAEFEEHRVDFYPFSAQSIDIIPVINKFSEKYNTTDPIDPDDDGFIMIQKIQKFLNNGGDISTAIFKKGSLFEKLVIVKRSPSDITINVSIDPNNTNSGEYAKDFDITYPLTSIMINQPVFVDGTATLNITGLLDADTDIFVIYKDLYASNQGTTNPYGQLGKGAVVIYEEAYAGAKDIDFDFGSGLGRVETSWEGWAICDGRNGTQDRGGVFPIGFKVSDPKYANLNVRGGSETKTLSVAEMPKHSHEVVINPNSNSQTGSGKVTVGGDNNEGTPPRFQTSENGNGQEFSIMNPYIVSLWVKKIAE